MRTSTTEWLCSCSCARANISRLNRILRYDDHKVAKGPRENGSRLADKSLRPEPFPADDDPKNEIR